MSWFLEHRQRFQIVLLFVMIAALIGPWTFEKIFVPAEYTCSKPNVRLDENFCGIPWSGIRIYSWILGNFVGGGTSLVNGELAFSEWMREFLLFLIICLPLLPFFNTMYLALQKGQQHRRVFNIFTWVLALGGCLYLNFRSNQGQYLTMWGLWLYIIVATSALALEMSMFFADRKRV